MSGIPYEIIKLISSYDIIVYGKMATAIPRLARDRVFRVQMIDSFTVTTRMGGLTDRRFMGELHSTGIVPSMVWKNGLMYWHTHGSLVRLRTPEGAEQWFDSRTLTHRDNDRPAFILSDGTKMWFNHGRIHRAGGKPAVIKPDGTLKWIVHGVMKGKFSPGGSAPKRRKIDHKQTE